MPPSTAGQVLPSAGFGRRRSGDAKSAHRAPRLPPRMRYWLFILPALIVILAIIFPVLLFPYSRGVWMALDLALHPPFNAAEQQLRGNLTRYDDSVKM